MQKVPEENVSCKEQIISGNHLPMGKGRPALRPTTSPAQSRQIQTDRLKSTLQGGRAGALAPTASLGVKSPKSFHGGQWSLF